MSLSRVRCRAQIGLDSIPVEVQVHLAAGLPQFNIVGLAATEVKESRDRVRSALNHCGFSLPPGRITVNLAPADLPKDGGRFDLAIALAILVAAGHLPARGEDSHEFLGELGLAGELRAIRGALPAALAVHRCGRQLIAPCDNEAELALLPAGSLQIATDLMEVCAWWRDGQGLRAPGAGRGSGRATDASSTPEESDALQDDPRLDVAQLDDVQGQSLGKEALQVAAAGGHSVLFVGPPGCGKSMLAHRLPGILPALTDQERLQVAMVASLLPPALAGMSPHTRWQRPFRAPHHSASANAIIGGGSRVMPGEISLAHGGVLFLDELPEFDRRVLEALREPLETGSVAIARVGLRIEYPARFQLVAAMNPCPCGFFGSSARECKCRPQDVARYRARLSGPLLDRIDLRVGVQVPNAQSDRRVAGDCSAYSQTAVRERVAAARSLQWQRQACANVDLLAKDIECMGISRSARAALHRISAKRALSLRAQHRILRVARTLADLQSPDCTQAIEHAHIGQALQLRQALEAD